MDTKEAGSLGGKKRTQNLTPEQRSEAAKRAVAIRWQKKRAQKVEENPNTPPTDVV